MRNIFQQRVVGACLILLCGINTLLADGVSSLTRDDRCIVIHVDRQQRIVVQQVANDQVQVEPGQRGLVIWPEGVRDRWQYFTGNWTLPLRSTDAVLDYLLEVQSRGRQTPGIDSVDASGTTTLLAQVRLPEITRAAQGLTVPYDGAVLLDPRITFRRASAPPGQSLSAVVGIVRQGTKELFRIRFPAGVTVLKWNSVSDLPPALRDGLSPGRYEIECSTATGPQRASFKIADVGVARQVLARSDALATLLPTGSPLAIQVEVEQLVFHQPGLLADAMNRLDFVAESNLTTRLRALKKEVQERLLAPGASLRSLSLHSDATGDVVIDRIRDLIQASEWTEALSQLDAIVNNKEAAADRRRALAQMYRGVILSESSATYQDAAAEAFRNAIELLREIPDSAQDQVRAHNNYANFLLGRAQDRLQNHAFQIATGVRIPLFSTLAEWIEARDHYALATKQSRSPTEVSRALVDEARLYLFLSDLLRTLSAPDQVEASPFEAESITSKQARTLAERSIQIGNPGDALTQAAAYQVLGLCDFRAGKFDDALAHWEQALAICRDQGSLSGIENIHRCLGLCLRTMSPETKSKMALNHFLISEGLAEILRGRYPVDESGRSRAGFFARRAYVTEQVIELLIRDGQFARALRHAEQKKARALQDLLAVRNVSAAVRGPLGIETRDFLTNWPADTVGLEYFLGSDNAYLFIIERTGTVKVLQLKGRDGKAIVSRDLISRIHQVLGSLDHYAERLRLRLQSGRGFDHEWQEQFADLREVLVPQEVLVELKQSRLVVIAPHHVLHYFPFAALITSKDGRELRPVDVPQPRYLIDETFDLVSTPSLTVWREMQRQPVAHPQTAAAVGIVELPGSPRLQGVTADLDGARRHYGAKLKETLVERDATEGAVLDLLAGTGAVLIALHGSNHPDRPLESELLMYPDARHDGRLTAEELYRHPVRRDLVVLSACYSGLADRSPVPGDDLFGIQRALLSSGARTVVSGLWDVFDTTAPELIAGFHQQIANGESAARALAQSQREFLKKYRSTGEAEPYLHPYFWAVYTVVGDDRTTCAGSSSP